MSYKTENPSSAHPEPPASGTDSAVVSSSRFGDDLSLKLNARGNAHQLASILEEAARQIRANEKKTVALPWFTITTGSIWFDWRADDPSMPNTQGVARAAQKNTNEKEA